MCVHRYKSILDSTWYQQIPSTERLESGLGPKEIDQDIPSFYKIHYHPRFLSQNRIVVHDTKTTAVTDTPAMLFYCYY